MQRNVVSDEIPDLLEKVVSHPLKDAHSQTCMASSLRYRIPDKEWPQSKPHRNIMADRFAVVPHPSQRMATQIDTAAQTCMGGQFSGVPHPPQGMATPIDTAPTSKDGQFSVVPHPTRRWPLN